MAPSEMEQMAYGEKTDWRTTTSQKIHAIVSGIDERTKKIAVEIDRRNVQRKGMWALTGNVWRLVKKGMDELMQD